MIQSAWYYNRGLHEGPSADQEKHLETSKRTKKWSESGSLRQESVFEHKKMNC